METQHMQILKKNLKFFSQKFAIHKKTGIHVFYTFFTTYSEV